MPIYEYECTNCGNVEEVLQKMSDAPLELCSKCQGNLSKIISHSSFHLKGSGWYVTDYGGSSAGEKKASKNKQTAKAPEKSCSSAKCDTSCSNSKSKE